MRRFVRLVACLAAGVAAWGDAAFACGPDAHCDVDGGFYNIRMPDPATADKPVGAVIFFHGYGGQSAGVMANKALNAAINGLGLALIAPNGMNKSWAFPGSPRDHRDEFAFAGAVLDDALARFAIDSHRVMASGFSLGGSMVWQLACRMPERFAGFAPIAGAFWEPLPADCVAGAPADYRLPHIFHVHGLADRTVPMAGRPIGDRARQGDVYKGVDVWLRPLAPPPDPVAFQDAGFACERWSTGDAGGVELCLHEGGHSMRAAWVARAWKRLADVMRWTS